jgi:hypothetical protein
MGSGGELHQVRVDDHSTAAIPECRPTIRFAKDVLSRHLARPHFLISPKNIALRMAAFGKQPIGQTDSFYGFAVIDSANFDASLLFEIVKD